ncbi:MAG: hypothetical protein LBM00_01345 [Deltaproteobacteria bacterium]|nr:hypothetical protein [Deltaproteobacteria bacterium]
MGDILTLRLMAQTLNEEEVAAAWPALCTLVWPAWADTLKLQTLRLAGLSGSVPRSSSVERFFGQKKHGVLELAQGLEDFFSIDEAPGHLLSAVREPLARLKTVYRQLNKALEDWKTQEANLLTNRLEEALNALEEAMLRADDNFEATHDT